MYEALIVIFTATGIQLTFSWNFHKVYTNLYKEFHNAVEEIIDKRLKLFREELKVWMSELFGEIIDSVEQKGKHIDIDHSIVLELNNISVDPKSETKVKELYDLVSKADEPKILYEEVREASRALYRYLLASGLSTLLGLIPQISGNSQFNVLYFVFLFPLMAAVFSYDTYDKAEHALIKLRDQGAK